MSPSPGVALMSPGGGAGAPTSTSEEEKAAPFLRWDRRDTTRDLLFIKRTANPHAEAQYRGTYSQQSYLL
jgi:hypothetical protein